MNFLSVRLSAVGTCQKFQLNAVPCAALYAFQPVRSTGASPSQPADGHVAGQPEPASSGMPPGCEPLPRPLKSVQLPSVVLVTPANNCPSVPSRGPMRLGRPSTMSLEPADHPPPWALATDGATFLIL